MVFWLLILFVAFLAFVMGLIAKSDKNYTKKDSPQEVFKNPEALELKMPKKLKESLDGDDVNIKVTIKTDKTLAYARHPQLKEAEALKYNEPEKALEVLLPLCDEEKGIYVKHVCLFCYRKLKDPESEKKMIYRIFDKIETIKEDECDEIEYEYIKNCRPVYESRLRWVETLIERKRKKEALLAEKKKS